jgi:hypothetical protein
MYCIVPPAMATALSVATPPPPTPGTPSTYVLMPRAAQPETIPVAVASSHAQFGSPSVTRITEVMPVKVAAASATSAACRPSSVGVPIALLEYSGVGVPLGAAACIFASAMAPGMNAIWSGSVIGSTVHVEPAPAVLSGKNTAPMVSLACRGISAESIAPPAACQRIVPFQSWFMLLERSNTSSTLPGSSVTVVSPSTVSVPQFSGSGVVGPQNCPTTHMPPSPICAPVPAAPELPSVPLAPALGAGLPNMPDVPLPASITRVPPMPPDWLLMLDRVLAGSAEQAPTSIVATTSFLNAARVMVAASSTSDPTRRCRSRTHRR